MTETFRLRKSVKHQRMTFAALFFAAMVGYGSIFFLEEPAKHGFKGEHSVVIVGGMGLAVFGTMLLMSIPYCVSKNESDRPVGLTDSRRLWVKVGSAFPGNRIRLFIEARTVGPGSHGKQGTVVNGIKG